MLYFISLFIVTGFASSEPAPKLTFNYETISDDVYDQHINLMKPTSFDDLQRTRDRLDLQKGDKDNAFPFDFSQFEKYLHFDAHDDGHSETVRRVKRSPRDDNRESVEKLPGPKLRERFHHYKVPEPLKDRPMDFPTTKRPGILPDQMNPGVVFRVRMIDIITRIKQRMYEDPEIHMDADIIYTNLIKKVVMDEINKFHNLLLMYRTDKSIKEHLGECGGRIYKFISYMTVKVHLYCLFDALWIDGNPYVIGDEYSVTPVDSPPVLQCDAAECSSVMFVDAYIEDPVQPTPVPTPT